MRYTMMLLSLCTGLTHAQDLEEHLTVQYRELRIHVQDKDKNPVRGLTRDDLQLLLEDQELEISYFEEINFSESDQKQDQAGVAQTEEERFRFVTVVIDSSQMRERHFQNACASLKDFIQRRAKGKTYLRLAHIDGSDALKTDFSNKPEYLLDALGRIEYKGNMLSSVMIAQLWLNHATGFSAFVRENGGESHEGSANDAELMRTMQLKEATKFTHFAQFSAIMEALADDVASVSGEKSLFMVTGGQYAPLWMTKTLGQNLNDKGLSVYSLMFDAARPVPFAPESVSDHYQLTKTSRETAEQSGGLFAKAAWASGQSEKFAELERSADHYYRIAFAAPRGGGKLVVMASEGDKGWSITHSQAAQIQNQSINKELQEAVDRYQQELRLRLEFRQI